MHRNYLIRKAKIHDLPALLGLEQARFTSDRISPRSFRRWLGMGHPGLAVADCRGELGGYVLLLRRRGSRIARLYSIAVAPDAAGQGLGKALLVWAEQRARDWGARCLRLEVQADNRSARGLYAASGYQLIDALPGYYEDGSDALRMEKKL